MIEMNEWQPAILVNAHQVQMNPGEEWAAAIGRRVRIRKIDCAAESQWREVGCDATTFFEVHSDDLAALGIYGRRGACEHEALTD
jgi:hypothetical protein